MILHSLIHSGRTLRRPGITRPHLPWNPAVALSPRGGGEAGA